MSFINFGNAENLVPELPNKILDEHTGNPLIESETIIWLKKMILLKILRPDRFIAAARLFVSKVLGDQMLSLGDLDLNKIVEKESNAKSPLLLVSSPGFDASYKVDMLAKTANKKYTSVAIGSPEAFD
jgi:dynein heavy chain 1